MLTIWGQRQTFCDRLERRSFLKIGAFGAGLTLADLLRGRAAAAVPGEPTPRQKSAIMIYLNGGPSHIDTYDPKPDAPAEIRGEFGPIATNVPGVYISEYLPLQARMWDKLAVIRSVVTVDEHDDSYITTGFSRATNLTAHHPSLGSVVSKLRGTQNGVPPYVTLRGLFPGSEPGYLGAAHRAYEPSRGSMNLGLPPGITSDRFSSRRSLLQSFDDVRRDIDDSGLMNGLDAFTTTAFEMIASGKVRKALDLNQEDQRMRDRYQGIEAFLTARRLVEAGVSVVTLGLDNWDTHGVPGNPLNFPTLRAQLPTVDKGVSTLIQDLHDRGLNEDVVTIMWGEFGRSPRINNGAGRDHWAPCGSALVAGGGLKMGQVVGASNSRGEFPKEARYTGSQVLSTLYRVLGIDPSRTFLNANGRPMYILDEREPVVELLG